MATLRSWAVAPPATEAVTVTDMEASMAGIEAIHLPVWSAFAGAVCSPTVTWTVAAGAAPEPQIFVPDPRCRIMLSPKGWPN